MEIINVTAMPVVPVADPLTISLAARHAMQNAARKSLEGSPPSCLIGSIQQVNREMAEIDLSRPLLDSSLIQAKENHRLLAAAQNPGTSDLSLLKGKRQIKTCWQSCTSAPSSTSPGQMSSPTAWCSVTWWTTWSSLRGAPSVARELEKYLSSPSLRAIWLDSFWWIFHERFQTNIEVQNQLFDRIAQHYAFLLFRGCRSHYEDAILKRLPSLLSKGLYTSFCCCFPQSWFNSHEFKSDVCNTMSLWISGIYPCPQSYDSWDYSKLDPERFWREELMSHRRRLRKGRERSFLTSKTPSSQKSTQSKKVPGLQSTSAISNSEKDSVSKKTSEDTSQIQNTTKEHSGQTRVLRRATQQVLRISEARLYETLRPKKSHPACKNPELTSSLFNIYGKSPLIVHFLLNYVTLQRSGQDVLITRKEKTKTIPESSLTYADIISATLCNMKKRKEALRQLNLLYWSEWTYFDEHLKELQDTFLREMKIVDQREAEKKKANHMFIHPSILNERIKKKSRGSIQREITFLLRKQKAKKERQESNYPPVPLLSPDEHSSLKLEVSSSTSDVSDSSGSSQCSDRRSDDGSPGSLIW